MSSSSHHHHNCMENVPVKISEKYKPPPRIFQIPQTITNRMALSGNHYDESSQYKYDFQLEHKVLAKMHEWRHMREQSKEARQERKEKRGQERLRQIERRQRQLLGAVSYPNAEEFSSSTSSDDETMEAATATTSPEETKIEKCEQKQPILGANSFNDILKPTILRHYLPKEINNLDYIVNKIGKETSIRSLNNRNVMHAGNAAFPDNCDDNKIISTFNYKDFEEDTSSPFDNCELKTINDLDVLAQVLHNTQLDTATLEKLHKLGDGESTMTKDAYDEIDLKTEEEEYIEKENQVESENIKNGSFVTSSESQLVPDIFNQRNIPQNNCHSSDMYSMHLPTGQQNEVVHTTFIPTPQELSSLSLSSFHEHQPKNFQQNSNLNLLNAKFVGDNLLTSKHLVDCTTSSNARCNSNFSYKSPQHVCSIQHQQNYIYNNGNNLNSGTQAGSSNQFISLNHTMPCNGELLHAQHTELIHTTNDSFSNDVSKSKSVPDIIKELKDELYNSELRRRRNRNYSANHGDKSGDNDGDVYEQLHHNAESQRRDHHSLQCSQMEYQCLLKLEDKTRNLALSISAMGFPLERVAKAAETFGSDDKKIIEHLIPLGELLDLGFDETEISEALIKFDNNKDKALEYLIT